MSVAIRILEKIESVNSGIIKYLFSHYNMETGFLERSFYGESFFAATCVMRDPFSINTQDMIRIAIEKTKDPKNDHQEFNLYALNEIAFRICDNDLRDSLQKIKFRQFFFRKVSNWVLLRSLLRIKYSRSLFSRFFGKCQARIILSMNRVGPYITDNTLRMAMTKKDSISSQYHAFATLIIGEIDRKFYQQYFFQGLDVLIKEWDAHSSLTIGRGKKQIFGHVAFLYSSVMAYSKTGDEKYLIVAEKILDRLISFQELSGKIPVVLVGEQNQQSLLYSYNNIFDYLPFVSFFLEKTRECIHKSKITNV